MAAITRKGVESVAAGNVQVFGSDVTVQLWPFLDSSGPQDEIDVTGFGIGSDWVTASVGRGLIFEFALTNGTLSVDNALNHKVYGKEATADDILHGKVS
jgi:lipid-binding SYLF domain-containing protein